MSTIIIANALSIPGPEAPWGAPATGVVTPVECPGGTARLSATFTPTPWPGASSSCSLDLETAEDAQGTSGWRKLTSWKLTAGTARMSIPGVDAFLRVRFTVFHASKATLNIIGDTPNALDAVPPDA